MWCVACFYFFIIFSRIEFCLLEGILWSRRMSWLAYDKLKSKKKKIELSICLWTSYELQCNSSYSPSSLVYLFCCFFLDFRNEGKRLQRFYFISKHKTLLPWPVKTMCFARLYQSVRQTDTLAHLAVLPGIFVKL